MNPVLEYVVKFVKEDDDFKDHREMILRRLKYHTDKSLSNEKEINEDFKFLGEELLKDFKRLIKKKQEEEEERRRTRTRTRTTRKRMRTTRNPATLTG